MIATLRQRNFALLWFAGLISLMGNWMLNIALPVTVYEMTGSTLSVAGLLLARTIPAILFSSIAGVLVDRWERRNTIIIINILQALVLLPLLLVQSPDWLWLIYLVNFAQSSFSQLFAPAENAFLPLLSDPKYLVSANALNALNNNLARLIGPALGGLIAPVLGLSGVAIIDSITFLVAAILCVFITLRSHPAKENGDTSRLSIRKVASEWLDGVRIIWRNRTVRTLFLLFTLPALSESVMGVLFVPFVTEILHGDSLHVGGLMSAQAIGGIIGGVLISWISQRVNTARLLGISAVLFGLADFGLFNYSMFFTGIALAYVFIILAGPLAVGTGASFNTLIQTEVADAYRGRVFSTFILTDSFFSLMGIAIAGFAADRVGIVPIINLQPIAYTLVGIGCLILLKDRASRSLAVSVID